MLKLKFNNLKEFIIYIIFLLYIHFFRLLGLDTASYIMGKILRLIGPYHTKSKVVIKNLKMIYPDLSKSEISKMLSSIWENFGRYLGEFPFVDKKYLEKINERIKLNGFEKIQKLINEKKKILIFSSHSANWEFEMFSILKKIDDCSIIYRKINNRFIDQYIKSKRKIMDVHSIEKGLEGSKDLLKALKSSKNILLLQDQKMNEGISVPFLGKKAMTSDSSAKISRQFEYTLVPVFIKRTIGVNFEIEVYDPIYSEKTDDKESDIYKTTKRMNDIISSWINKYPTDWFWFHQRWVKFDRKN